MSKLWKIPELDIHPSSQIHRENIRKYHMDHAEGRISDKDFGSSPKVSRNFAVLHLFMPGRDPLKHCDALRVVASWSVSEKCCGEVLRSWAKDTSIHGVCMCAHMDGCASLYSRERKIICTLHQFSSFLWFLTPARHSVMLKYARRCVPATRCVRSFCVRGGYDDEQLPLNDRLCPAAVINHAHCPFQPPSNTHKRPQAAAQAGRDKQNSGTTNPPINTWGPLSVMLGRRARRSKSTQIRGAPPRLLSSSS